MMVLAFGFSNYLQSHPLLLSLAFASVMILSDRQDAGFSRQGNMWWFRLGVLLLSGFTFGALLNRLWTSFVIGLAALYIDLRLLRRTTPLPPRESWWPLSFGLSQWKEQTRNAPSSDQPTNPELEK